MVVLVAVATGSTSAARTATPAGAGSNLSSNAFFPSGTFHMAASKSNDSLIVNAVDGEVTVLQVAFSVPSGQRADIAAFFSAEAYKYPNGYCYLTFYIDQIGVSRLAPGQVWVADGYVYSGAYPTLSAQGWRSNVAAGAHSLLVTLSTTGGDCYVRDRSIILTSNRHA